MQVVSASPENISEINQILNRYIIEKKIPGLATGFWHKILTQYYRQRTLLLIAKDQNNEICGFFFGYHAPHDYAALYNLHYGFDAQNHEVAQLLFENIRQYCIQNKIEKTLISLGRYSSPTLEPKSEKTDLFIPLKKEDLWESIPKKTRNMIKKAENENFTLSWSWDNFNTFYKLYEDHFTHKNLKMKDYAYYALLKETFGDNLLLLTAQKNNNIVAGMIFLKSSCIASYLVNSSHDEAAQRGVNNWLMWQAIRKFSQENVEYLQLGESTPKGNVFEFKRKLHKDIIISPIQYYDVFGLEADNSARIKCSMNHRIILILLRTLRFMPQAWKKNVLKFSDHFGRVI